MKKRTIIFLAVFLVVAAMWFSRKIIYRVVVTTHLNEKLAEFELQDLDGNLILSADYKGKVLVLDFWTTWCGVCLKAFPDFQEVYEKFKDHPDVAFLAVNMGERIQLSRSGRLLAQIAILSRWLMMKVQESPIGLRLTICRLYWS